MSRRTVFLFMLALFATRFVSGQTKDAPGSKDHPLVKRYEGSVIHRYSEKAFDEYQLPLGPAGRGGVNAPLTKSAHLEGRVTRIMYLAPPNRSTLEVMRNYEAELTKAGYSVLFAAAGDALSPGTYAGSFANAAGLKTNGVPGSALLSMADVSSKDQRFLAAKLARPQGDVHVAIYATAMEKAAPTGHGGEVVIQLDVVEAAAMETKMVTVSAADMAAGIASSGSVAVYGVLFDTNSANVEPASDATLSEIARLLTTQPALKLLVVGHTDNVGTFDANLDLSRRRAAAVVNVLASKYRIDVKRLTPVGVSFASPVASNKTEEGRAKNRRVQLVEQ
jgi:outer membrane protein OmpA-like peptidoglycan-associated protein